MKSYRLNRNKYVFSTSVEVFLSTFGDRSPASQSSPRPWRCFHSHAFPCLGVVVFSTSVEVFPPRSSAGSTRRGLLHVRGGVSTGGRIKNDRWQSSPRPWRCFLAAQFGDCLQCVFSTSVEVFPFFPRPQDRDFCLLHVRGGVSEAGLSVIPSHVSSPRPWRCFRRPGGLRRYGHVFSTSVEVFSIEKLAGR